MSRNSAPSEPKYLESPGPIKVYMFPGGSMSDAKNILERIEPKMKIEFDPDDLKPEFKELSAYQVSYKHFNKQTKKIVSLAGRVIPRHKKEIIT
jgi:hypothetical protein